MLFKFRERVRTLEVVEGASGGGIERIRRRVVLEGLHSGIGGGGGGSRVGGHCIAAIGCVVGGR